MKSCFHCGAPSEILVSIKRYAGYGDDYYERDICPNCFVMETTLEVKSEVRVK